MKWKWQMDLYWFEQRMGDVPEGEEWLSPGEVAHLRSLRFPRRRADWLLGRWTAKIAVSTLHGLRAEPDALSAIEIRSAPSGAPEVFFMNAPLAVLISLSHRSGIAACALAWAGSSLGCDLETVEPHGDTFPADYFTPEEQALVTEAPTKADGLCFVSLLWSAKESALKLLGEGLRIDTRCVVVKLPRAHEDERNLPRPCFCAATIPQRTDWSPLQVCYMGRETFCGWWSQTGKLLRTVLTVPAPGPPIVLCESLRPFLKSPAVASAGPVSLQE